MPIIKNPAMLKILMLEGISDYLDKTKDSKNPFGRTGKLRAINALRFLKNITDDDVLSLVAVLLAVIGKPNQIITLGQSKKLVESIAKKLFKGYLSTVNGQTMVNSLRTEVFSDVAFENLLKIPKAYEVSGFEYTVCQEFNHAEALKILINNLLNSELLNHKGLIEHSTQKLKKKLETKFNEVDLTILPTETMRKAYKEGAANGAFMNLPSDLAKHAGSFLTREEGAKLAATSRSASKFAQDNVKEREAQDKKRASPVADKAGSKSFFFASRNELPQKAEKEQDKSKIPRFRSSIGNDDL